MPSFNGTETINERASTHIHALAVRTRIGETEWVTSVFFDRKRGTYLLPAKATVRSAEGLDDGDEVQILIAPIDS
ncbi:MAG: DUF1905 domain-containing protein [Solirubrobacterales bacterium]|nr:DUF1905 domain-containing protein [Solirubrobacterales bacterium]